ncbi:hypothetical protein N5C81_28065 [Rhizobium pusense]|nr:hypothetical protein [Agrobacterium pusense]MDH1271453.1 hypothetical protein [Agrobacterium pusense]
MLFDLPDPETLYAALLARNERFDGQVFVCVASTGVFCRLTCPARKPKRENCTFYPTIGECVEAGYRPCKRCHPLQAAALADPTIAALLHALDMRPGRRWSENHVIKLGYDPSTVRRSFRRQFGMTFLEWRVNAGSAKDSRHWPLAGKLLRLNTRPALNLPARFAPLLRVYSAILHLSCNRTSSYGQHGYLRRSAS